MIFNGSTTLLGVALRLFPVVDSEPEPATGTLPNFAPPRSPSAIVTERVNTIFAVNARGFSNKEVEKLAEVVRSAAEEYDVDPYLILAIIEVESTFKRRQRSSAGALGLMQVMPATGQSFAKRVGVPWNGPGTLLEPESNIRIGTAYFAWLLERFDGNVTRALTGYCHGPRRVVKILRNQNKLPEDRLRYSRKVLAAWRSYLDVELPAPPPPIS